MRARHLIIAFFASETHRRDIILIFILRLKVAWCWFLDLKMARFMRQVTLSPTSKTVDALLGSSLSISSVTVEVRHRNEDRGVVVPLALGRDGRRPVPAAGAPA